MRDISLLSPHLKHNCHEGVCYWPSDILLMRERRSRRYAFAFACACCSDSPYSPRKICTSRQCSGKGKRASRLIGSVEQLEANEAQTVRKSMPCLRDLRLWLSDNKAVQDVSRLRMSQHAACFPTPKGMQLWPTTERSGRVASFAPQNSSSVP